MDPRWSRHSTCFQIYCKLSSLQCTIYSLQWNVYICQCLMFSLQSTVYTSAYKSLLGCWQYWYDWYDSHKLLPQALYSTLSTVCELFLYSVHITVLYCNALVSFLYTVTILQCRVWRRRSPIISLILESLGQTGNYIIQEFSSCCTKGKCTDLHKRKRVFNRMLWNKVKWLNWFWLLFMSCYLNQRKFSMNYLISWAYSTTCRSCSALVLYKTNVNYENFTTLGTLETRGGRGIAKIAKLRNLFLGLGNFLYRNMFGFWVNRLVPQDKHFCLDKPAYSA